MHSVFEGVVPCCINLLLQHLIDEEHLVILDVTNHLLSFLSKHSSTKPAIIYRESGVGTKFVLKQTASQMKALIRRLPLAIGNYIPNEDEHWMCFLMLWDICCLCLVYEITEDDAGHMSWLVETFLAFFFTLFW
jgi:hypothetical protein